MYYINSVLFSVRHPRIKRRSPTIGFFFFTIIIKFYKVPMVFNAISEVFPPSLTFFYRNEDPIFSYLKLSKMNFAKCKKK